MKTLRYPGLFLLLPVALALCLPAHLSASPEISNVVPDWSGRHLRPEFHFHHLITGEDFTESTTFHTWQPDGDAKKAIQEPDFENLELPAKPPENAKRISPIDIQNQVAVAALQTGTVVWATDGGEKFSAPYLFNIAKPFWVSDDNARPLQLLFGFGLRIRGEVALRGKDRVYFPQILREPRASRATDPNLVYFEVPEEIEAGEYAVYFHNGNGGQFGWRKGGSVTISTNPLPEKPEFDVREFGAVGDGIASDLEALRAAIAAAREAGGGKVLLPPGTYRVEETLRIPEQVELRGAGGTQSIIEGFQYNPLKALRGWWANPVHVAASVLVMESNSRIEQIGVHGYVSKGDGGYALIAGASPDGTIPERITIRDCVIRADAENPESPRAIYRAALAFSGSSRISILGNDITGALEMRPGTYRSDIIDNKFRKGTVLDVVSINVMGSDNLIDANLLVDTPGRFVLYRSIRSYIRNNEIHNHGRAGWTNVPEPFLLHGGSSQTTGNPTAAEANTLQDTRQQWQENSLRNATVLISAGKGMGQYRIVKGNSPDTLELEEPWRVIPDETSEYSVGKRFTENVLFANQNHTPGRTSLWLDCIATVVEKHRDAWAGGIDIWGQDRSRVNDEGEVSLAQRFHPSWFNIITDSWLDGSSAGIFGSSGAENNAYRGVPNFGNFFMLNRIKSPHLQRNPGEGSNFVLGGIRVEGGEGRTGASHTMVLGNSIANTRAGVLIVGESYKTFVLGNHFHDVEFPIINESPGTYAANNSAEVVTASGTQSEQLPAINDDKLIADFEPPSIKEPMKVRESAGRQEAGWLQSKVAWRGFPPENPESKQAITDQANELARVVRNYIDQNGTLPDAAFYPIGEPTERKSLAEILGPEDAKLLVLPGHGGLENIHFLWNENLSGKRLEEIENPESTWMLADFLATHGWLVTNQYASQGGEVPVVFADGSVRWIEGGDAARLIRGADLSNAESDASESSD